jgi:hypothetical protein
MGENHQQNQKSKAKFRPKESIIKQLQRSAL